jgi:hypothetical protein
MKDHTAELIASSFAKEVQRSHGLFVFSAKEKVSQYREN